MRSVLKDDSREPASRIPRVAPAQNLDEPLTGGRLSRFVAAPPGTLECGAIPAFGLGVPAAAVEPLGSIELRGGLRLRGVADTLTRVPRRARDALSLSKGGARQIPASFAWAR